MALAVSSNNNDFPMPRMRVVYVHLNPSKFGSSGKSVVRAGVSCEQAIVFESKEQALKNVDEFGRAIAAPIEDFEFVIEHFDKADMP